MSVHSQVDCTVDKNEDEEQSLKSFTKMMTEETRWKLSTRPLTHASPKILLG